MMDNAIIKRLTEPGGGGGGGDMLQHVVNVYTYTH